MRNELSTSIRKITDIVGAGLLEVALGAEGCKGCSPIVCCDPVELEPPYDVFDGAQILGARESRHTPAEIRDQAWVTMQIYAAPDDILSLDWLEALFRGLAVFPTRFAFELTGAGKKISVRLAFAREHQIGVVAALTGIFPALRLREVERPFQPRDPRHALVVEEVVPRPPYHRTLSLIKKEGVSPLGIAYRAMEALEPGELGTYQVTFQATAPEHDWHFNIQALLEAEQRAAEFRLLGGLSNDFSYDWEMPARPDASAAKKIQLDCATFAVVCRYAAWAEPGRAEGFLSTMRAATGVLRFGNRTWRRLSPAVIEECLGKDGAERMVTRRRTHRCGLVVSSHELASFAHLPAEWALEMFPSIERRKGVEWRSPEVRSAATPPGDALIGHNDYAGRVVPVVIPLRLRLRHWHVLGRTGNGKSYLLLSVMLEDALSGMGFCLIDPHGDLAIRLLACLPEERLGDVVYVSFAEDGCVPRWNPFMAKVPPGKFADDFVRAFAAMFDSFGARMAHIIRHAAYATHCIRGNLEDFAELLSDSDRGRQLRKAVLERLENPEARRFWLEEFASYRGEHLDAVRNKLSPPLLSEKLGATFRGRENTVEPREWMDSGKIVVVNLATGRLGGEGARFVGGLLCSLIHRAALSRDDVAETARRPFFLFLDECQQLQSAALEEMLSEARKYGLGVVLAHQAMKQLEPEVSHAMGNCATFSTFQPVDEDIAYARRALLSRVSMEDLASLQEREVYAVVGNRVGSLTTVTCDARELRDGREYARALARRTSAATEDRSAASHAPVVVRRRERIYDRIGTEEDRP